MVSVVNTGCHLLKFKSAVEAEIGQAALEFALGLMVLIVILAGIMTIGPLTYANIGVHTAASDCAFAAAQSLNAEQARFQGISAAQETLGSYSLNASGAAINVMSDFKRGAPVVCQVAYDLDLGQIPLVGMLNPETHIVSRVILPAQAFKSTWK